MLCYGQFFVFSNVHICFVLRHRIAVQFFVFALFSNVHICFVLCQTIAVQFFIFVMSVLCSVMFNFLYLVMFMSVLCSVMFSFLYLVMLMCLVLGHKIAVQFFANFSNIHQVYLNLRVYLIVFVFIGYVFIL